MSTFSLKTILCPVDFSDLSALALRYAADFRDCSGGNLVVLFANPFLPPPQLSEAQINQMAQTWEASKKVTEQYLVSFVESHLGRSCESIETIVIDSVPVDAIVDFARAREADLVVMGTHGKGGENRMLLGSVAERVLRVLECPVLTVRPKKGSAKPSAAIKNILVPVNFSVVSRMAVVSAARIADCFGATLSVMRVIEPIEEPCDESDEMTRLCAWIPTEIRKKCEIQEFVFKGESAEKVVAFAEEEKSDLIVMGAQHRKFFDSTIVGTTTIRVVRHAPCPVFTLIRKQ